MPHKRYFVIMREELFHPLLAHFPIVFFILTLGLKAAECFIPTNKERWGFFSLITLILALGSYLMTLYLGDMALDHVRSTLCQIRPALLHESLAQQGLWPLFPLLFLEALSKKIGKWASYLSLFILLVMSGMIIKIAHSGAMLVYEHGAGVIVSGGQFPRVPCRN